MRGQKISLDKINRAYAVGIKIFQETVFHFNFREGVIPYKGIAGLTIK